MSVTNWGTTTVEMDSTSIINARKKKEETTSNSFTLEDFYKLFAAQLQNQDMMNPVDDSQFLAQMAQMATIQSTEQMVAVMEQMNTMTMTSYAFEFMGKEVIIAADKEGGKEGELETIRGVVERVSLYDGEPKVFVNDKAYSVSQVMEVFPKTTETQTPTVPPDEKDENEEEKDPAVNGTEGSGSGDKKTEGDNTTTGNTTPPENNNGENGAPLPPGTENTTPGTEGDNTNESNVPPTTESPSTTDGNEQSGSDDQQEGNTEQENVGE